MKSVSVFLLLGAVMASMAFAGAFTNGGFETGDWTGWDRGAGRWNGAWPEDPNLYLPGGTRYDMEYWRGNIVTPGPDPVVGSVLNRVYNGNYAARINDQFDNYDYSVGVIKQKVTNYTDPHIYFAWAAVLEASHDATDSDNFTLKVVDETLGDTLLTRSYSSYTAPGVFHGSYWFYSDWKTEDIAIDAARQGHDFSIMLLASDCAWGGHAGYAYLDGFAPVIIPKGDVPEPATVGLIGSGLLALAWVKLRSRKSAS